MAANDALLTLNEIVDKWNTENLMIPFTMNIEVPMSGKSKYTIGKENADVNMERPVAGIQNAYFKLNNNTYPIEIFTRGQYDNLVQKELSTNIVNYVYYNATYPNGELYIYPQATNGTIVLTVGGQFSIFNDLDAVIDLPAGYIKALRYNLAVELSPEYGVQTDQQVIEHAIGAKNTIKATNSVQKTMLMTSDVALLGRRGGFNIYTGE